MKFTPGITALVTVSLVIASDPRILARTDDVTAVEKREPQGLIGFQCQPWYKCCPPCAEDLAGEANAVGVEKRQGLIGFECKPWMLCWPHGPEEVIEELEAKNNGTEKRQGLIGFQCYPWMACWGWPHGSADATDELTAKADTIEKRQGPPICWPCLGPPEEIGEVEAKNSGVDKRQMLSWPHLTEIEKQAASTST